MQDSPPPLSPDPWKVRDRGAGKRVEVTLAGDGAPLPGHEARPAGPGDTP